jgi:hypothetical protein
MFQPMSLGELLDGAFTLYRRHFTALVGVAAVCYGPFQLIRLYVEVGGGWREHLGLLFLSVLIGLVAGLIGSAAILKVVSDGYLGREPDARDALRFALGRIGALMLAGFARSILVMLGTMLLIVPGIIIACGYSVVSQVVVLESPPNALDSLARSWALTKGYRLTVLALAFVLFLVASIPGAIAGLLSVPFGIPARVVGALAALLLAPLVPCGLTLYYYDLRIRKEAFDLQALGQQLGDGSPA